MQTEHTNPSDTPETEPESGSESARPEGLEGQGSAHPEVSKDERGTAQVDDNAASEPQGGAIEERLSRAEEEAKKYLDNWRRAEADLQNYKRRTDQERDELRRFGNVSVIINLLPILDDFERAFKSLDSRLAGLSWFDGIYLIYRKLQQLLENAGVQPIEAEGQQFDPRFHEAVAHVEGEEGKVLSEVQRGYKLHDRVLRPAMVVVGKGKGEQSDDTRPEGA